MLCTFVWYLYRQPKFSLDQKSFFVCMSVGIGNDNSSAICHCIQMHLDLLWDVLFLNIFRPFVILKRKQDVLACQY